jgi:hypothetical protein
MLLFFHSYRAHQKLVHQWITFSNPWVNPEVRFLVILGPISSKFPVQCASFFLGHFHDISLRASANSVSIQTDIGAVFLSDGEPQTSFHCHRTTTAGFFERSKRDSYLSSPPAHSQLATMANSQQLLNMVKLKMLEQS